ncbi:TetR/AcrR family transcriptional regulator [Subtercola endophyticus]|uniref:TetR/AcrR family transcriptional regulator n=1 Tax=Subtercola endophyticus TaxID=2895559 RepID=UPI001E4F474B|nr:TetR family transcriptional regulator [Subtercola endophyticus]UFS59663.1 TetR family transcriptional regulator [Subtercola endophyticus]
MEPQQQPGPGRPRAALSSDVAALALRMFERDGYDETTMQNIADAAGISRPTLFRYFRSKTDIVWDRYEEEADELRHTLATASPDRPPLDVLCDILPRLLQYADDDLDLLRTQVTIIASVPAVQGHAHRRSAEWVSIMAEFIAARSSASATDLLPMVMSRCVWNAGWSALTYWAASDQRRPDTALATAFAGLRSGFSLDALSRL